MGCRSTEQAPSPRPLPLALPGDHVPVLHREARTSAVAVVHRPVGGSSVRSGSSASGDTSIPFRRGLTATPVGAASRGAGAWRRSSRSTAFGWVSTMAVRSGTGRIVRRKCGGCSWAAATSRGYRLPSYVLATGRGLCAVWGTGYFRMLPGCGSRSGSDGLRPRASPLVPAGPRGRDAVPCTPAHDCIQPRAPAYIGDRPCPRP